MRNLIIGGKTVENCVAVRKTTESIDDRLVRHGVSRPLLIAEQLDQVERERLILAILAMLEGKVNKVPFLSFHSVIETLFNCASGKLAGDGIR